MEQQPLKESCAEDPVTVTPLLSGSASHACSLYFNLLMRVANENPSADAATFECEDVDIADFFIRSRSLAIANVNGAKEMIGCSLDKRILELLSQSVDKKLGAFLEICVEVYGVTTDLSGDDLLQFLQHRITLIHRKMAELSRLVRVQEELCRGVTGLLNVTTRNIMSITQQRNLQLSDDVVHPSLLRSYEDSYSVQLQHAAVTLQDHYFTRKRISDNQRRLKNFQERKQSAEHLLFEGLLLKNSYEALGKEFKHLAGQYGQLLRITEMEAQLFSSPPSP